MKWPKSRLPPPPDPLPQGAGANVQIPEPLQPENFLENIMKIKVLLVDDHKIMRDGLVSLLADAGDIEVVAEAGNGGEAIEKSLAHAPDVVVMDLTLPDIGGIEATRQIMSKCPHVRVLILSMLMDRTCVLESLEAGARGYLVKDCAAEELVSAIRAIHSGKPYFCAEATEIMLKGFIPGSASKQIFPSLTNREQEVLKLTAEGNNTKEIAYTLGVSVKMIEIHRMNLKRKLGLNSIAQLTTYAVRTGLISIE
jgi:DNA-binding NarL/FixJ family response regulator